MKDKGIYCALCNDRICKYEHDLNDCGGIAILIDSKLNWKYVCDNCARYIARELIEK